MKVYHIKSDASKENKFQENITVINHEIKRNGANGILVERSDVYDDPDNIFIITNNTAAIVPK